MTPVQVVELVALALCIWVAADAWNLGARRGALGGGMLDMGPAGWFFSCLLVPLVGLICYAATRPRLARRRRALDAMGWSPAGAGTAYNVATPPSAVYQSPQRMRPPPPLLNGPPAAPPAGWYVDPNSPTGRRWWDGTVWTPHV